MIKTEKIGNNEPIIIEFGTGDIMISTAIPEKGDFRDLYFSQVEEGKIGGSRDNHNEKISDEIKIPVGLRFNNTESIDVLISQLINVKHLLTNKKQSPKLNFLFRYFRYLCNAIKYQAHYD